MLKTCKFCGTRPIFYMVDLRDPTSHGYYVCIKHADPNYSSGAEAPKDQRPSEVQSSDAAHRPED